MVLNLQQKAFFLLVLKQRDRKAPDFFSFLPPEQNQQMNQLFQELKSSSAKEISNVASTELKKLSRARTNHYLSDVHNDWLAEILKWESPEMISVILRYLPAERVRAILDLLPEEILTRLPSLRETFHVSSNLVEILRYKFESFFIYERSFNPEEPFSFQSLCFLHSEQLDKVFFELGYREIGLGLVALPAKTKEMVLDRLLPEDRKPVDYYIERAGEASEPRRRRAQVHVISKEVNPRKPRFFVKELGLLILAKSLLESDSEDLEIIKKKLSMHEAMALQRLVEKHIEKNTDATVYPFREDIVSTVLNVLHVKNLRSFNHDGKKDY